MIIVYEGANIGAEAPWGVEPHRRFSSEPWTRTGENEPELSNCTGKSATTNLAYHRARWMDSRVGRFTGMDPYCGELEDPSTLQKYVYGSNQPTERVDPRGTDAEDHFGSLLDQTTFQGVSLTAGTKIPIAFRAGHIPQCIRAAFQNVFSSPNTVLNADLSINGAMTTITDANGSVTHALGHTEYDEVFLSPAAGVANYLPVLVNGQVPLAGLQTILHELTHVDQYESLVDQYGPSTAKSLWDAQVLQEDSMPHDSRPSEIAARANAAASYFPVGNVIAPILLAPGQTCIPIQ